MINTQKLLIIILLMNLVIGLTTDIYKNPSDYTNNRIDNEIDSRTDFASNVKTEETAPSLHSATVLLENTVTNTVRMGTILFRVFIEGLNPFPISRNLVRTDFEKNIYTGLQYFRALMYILIATEIYMVFKNRKTN